MPDRRILIVGEIDKIATEMFETALALGFEPIVVLSPGQNNSGGAETWAIEQLPDSYRTLPAMLARSGLQPDIEDLRIDRQLYIRVSRHVELAAQHGIDNWISLVHPSAVISPSAAIGIGAFIGPLAVVSSRTTIADFARVGRGASIGHDVSIGSFCRIGPGAAMSSGVRIGEQSMVGTGAVFVNGVSIGERSLVGAGSVVTKSFPSDSLVWGNPAKLRDA
jgi:UDP-3-O-[3-hydroxymyristoyl] glucosamine N-acyltransferase